jgi:predicted AAA+ superfamily ATPase
MMLPRILTAPQQSFFLLGPRGSGKSTWLQAIFPEAHVFDLLAEETYQRLLAHPGLFAAELRALTANQWVIIDEVQRLPNPILSGTRFVGEAYCSSPLVGEGAILSGTILAEEASGDCDIR